MDFELSEELVAVRDLAREFAEKEIAPTAAKDDRERNFRKDLLLKMGELGFFGTVIPEEYGGNGLGFLALALITEEVARAHSALRVAINMQIGPALALLKFGDEEQKKKWIPPLVRGESVGCFAITEPDAGSDVAAIRTTAMRKGDNYLINGTKLWISNAPVADGGLVYAYTDKSQKHRGLSAFYANFDRLGITRRALETLGAHASPIGELTFENFAPSATLPSFPSSATTEMPNPIRSSRAPRISKRSSSRKTRWGIGGRIARSYLRSFRRRSKGRLETSKFT